MQIRFDKDYYSILEVSKTATSEEIKKSYKKLALHWHPDKNKSNSAEATFKEIGEAYELLSDPLKKAYYDLYRENDGLSRAFRSSRPRSSSDESYDTNLIKFKFELENMKRSAPLKGVFYQHDLFIKAMQLLLEQLSAKPETEIELQKYTNILHEAYNLLKKLQTNTYDCESIFGLVDALHKFGFTSGPFITLIDNILEATLQLSWSNISVPESTFYCGRYWSQIQPLDEQLSRLYHANINPSYELQHKQFLDSLLVIRTMLIQDNSLFPRFYSFPRRYSYSALPTDQAKLNWLVDHTIRLLKGLHYDGNHFRSNLKNLKHYAEYCKEDFKIHPIINFSKAILAVALTGILYITLITPIICGFDNIEKITHIAKVACGLHYSYPLHHFLLFRPMGTPAINKAFENTIECGEAYFNIKSSKHKSKTKPTNSSLGLVPVL